MAADGTGCCTLGTCGPEGMPEAAGMEDTCSVLMPLVFAIALLVSAETGRALATGLAG